ncbi:hypothetical protein [Clostridium sp. UBA5988]|uniref:hypothetical protein n=1 Tax=Clostridium sp. UBA5988 TaxID=1946369 RepID=UPI003216D22E
MISGNYYFIVKEIKELRRNYKNLDIEQKLKLLELELKSEGKSIKVKTEFVSKSVKRKIKHENYLRIKNKKVGR